MIPLEEAVQRNLDLKAQLEWQLDAIRSLGGATDTAALNTKCISQRLETLIAFMFEPQAELSREAFELSWEETFTEILETELAEANKVVPLSEPQRRTNEHRRA
jgi:hypothetical protein